MERKDNSSILKSSKFSSKEKRYLLIGILVETIFDKSLFKKNNELIPYVNGIGFIIGVTPYKDYLYHSRTILAARIIKDIFFGNLNTDEEYRRMITKKIINYHINFFEYLQKNDDKNYLTRNKNKSNLLDDMIDSKFRKDSNNK